MIHQLMCNRVWRPFIGGSLMEAWQGDKNPSEGHYPERWIGSCTVSGDGSGLSKTKDGLLLRDLLKQPPQILVKILDSYTRLMIQTHPNDEQAKKYFGHPFGKTEMWYVLDTREINGEKPYVLLGFKEGVTKEKWIDLFAGQDIEGQLNCLNKINVAKGDCFFVPANVPHAMGSGVFFAEIQQPIDITFRTERLTPAGEMLGDNMLHQGAGFDAMFNCFNYSPSNPDDYLIKRHGETIINNAFFNAQEFDIVNNRTLPLASDAIIIVLSGEGSVNSIAVRQADELYISEETELKVSGGMKALIFYC